MNLSDKSKGKSQSDKFREAARKLETDDDEARFDERLRKIAKSPEPAKSSEKVERKNPKGQDD